MTNTTSSATGGTPLSDALADPHWFPDALDPGQGTLHLVRTDRETLAGQVFLDERWMRGDLPNQIVPFAILPRPYPSGAARPKLNFIWHTAFCSSTAIAEALDSPGRNLSLREPAIVTTFANIKRAGAAGPRFPVDLARTVFHLLSRPFAPGESVLVKPSNAANHLLPEVAQLTEGKSLFLFSDCTSFLAAVARRGEDRGGYVRWLYRRIVGDGHEQQRWSMDKLFEMSDLQIAAIAWHMQIAELQKAWPHLGPSRAASLDCDAFLAAPGPTLTKLDAFFGLGLGEAHIAQFVEGTQLSRNAKAKNEAFALSERRREQETMHPRLRQDIAAIVAWSYEACRTPAHVGPLPDPLVAIDKDYGPA